MELELPASRFGFNFWHFLLFFNFSQQDWTEFASAVLLPLLGNSQHRYCSVCVSGRACCWSLWWKVLPFSTLSPFPDFLSAAGHKVPSAGGQKQSEPAHTDFFVSLYGTWPSSWLFPNFICNQYTQIHLSREGQFKYSSKYKTIIKLALPYLYNM